MTYLDLIKETQRKFTAAGVECGDFASHTVDFLIQVTGISREKLLLAQEEPVPEIALPVFENAAKRRQDGEPLQYIVGYGWFWNSKFKVGPGVLIPRKETEHLVEFLLTLPVSKNYKIAELGSGSGNIGISALQERPDWSWYGFELNRDSLPYLNQNARELLPASSNFKIVDGDFFEQSKNFGPFDIVISNPPYIAETEKKLLSREVRREPDLALFSGVSGLEHIEKLLIHSQELLVPGGHLISEIGSDQGTQVKDLAIRHGFVNVNVLKDMAGLDRVLVAQRRMD